MKTVYVCERPYNLYRTLLKAVVSDDDIDLVISNNFEGLDVMYDALKNCGLFNNVYFYNDLKHKTFLHVIKVNDTFAIEKAADIITIIKTLFLTFLGFIDYIKSQRKAKRITLPKGLDFDDYAEIHITECTSILNFYIYSRKFKNIVLVEHSRNGLQGQPSFLANILYFFEKLRLIYGIRGSCRYVRAVEVNENRGLTWETKGKEIREVPIDRLVDEVSSEKKEFIYQIYAKSYKLDFPDDANIDILLTTTIMTKKSKAMHVHLCKEAISRHMYDSDYIVIKPHPFDRTDYSEILRTYPNAVILPPYFSAEIFAFSKSLKIRKLINVDSSSVGAFKSVEQIITLGYEFVDECWDTLPC